MAYLKYILRHKWFVFWECLNLGIPAWTALAHDWDKVLMPATFAGFRKRYNLGNGYDAVADDPDYHMAYHLHCNRRNQHHWQWWISHLDGGKTRVLKMSDAAAREMLADWRGMARTLNQPRIWEWYAGYRSQMTVHPETQQWLDQQIVAQRLEWEANGQP